MNASMTYTHVAFGVEE